MLLAIDAGNTNIVFATFADGNALPRASWRLETVRDRTAEEYAGWLRRLDLPEIGAVIISSVVPPIDQALREACEEVFEITPIFVTHDMRGVDVVIDLPHPEQMGADRVVNAVAVLRDYQVPAIVVDCGTATTFDVIDAQGHFTGGVIAPGPHLSMKALHLAAAKLPDVPVAKPPAVIGTDTVSAMQSGVYWGYVGLIEGLVRGIASELGGKPYVIATGGLAELFAEGTNIIDKIDPDLTLRGLYYIYDKNVSSTDKS